MEKSSKKHIKLLAFMLTAMLALSVGVNQLVYHTGFGSFGSMRSGEFVNTSQGINRNGWYFNADMANGNSTFFAYLSQNELENITMQSSIGSGNAALVIFQDNVRLTYDLLSDVSTIVIDTTLFYSGRIDIRLYLVYAKNVHVKMSWGDNNQ